MRVACVVVPHFLIEAERLRDPALRGRPVVVGGPIAPMYRGSDSAGRRAPVRVVGSADFGLRCVGEERKEVLDCSPEAMARGVRPGMALREALSRCAEAAFAEAHPEHYRAITQAMVEALLKISPLVELAEPGVVYLGIGRGEGVGGRGGSCDPLEVELADTIGAVAREASGLSVRVGIADGKFAAYVAALLAPPAQRSTE